MRLRLKEPFPLLAKELLELAVRKRTYVVRVVYALALFAIFAYCYYDWSLSALRPGQGGGSPFSMLGLGAQAFQIIVGCQFAAILIFLPASMSGVIAHEKERDTLALLLLTDLQPGEILIEKYLSRLIPMLTMLLASLPLLALAYALGGFSPGDLCAGGYILFLTCLQVGAIALMVSAYSGGVVGAFIGSYVMIAAVYLAVPMGCGLGAEFLGIEGLRHIPDEAEIALIPPVQYLYWSARSRFGGGQIAFVSALLRSVPVLVSIVVFLLLARRYLHRRPFVRPRNLLLRVWEEVDPMVDWGVVLIREPDTLPHLEPVAWREVSKKSLGKLRYLIRIFVLLEAPILLVGLFVVSQGAPSRDEGEAFTFFVLLLCGLAVLATCMAAVNTISSERLHRTLDALLTTPLSGAEILRQKMRGVWRLALVFIGPLATLLVLEVWCEGAKRTAWAGPRDALIVLLQALLYVPMFAWGALWISLRLRNRLTAMFATLTTVVVWNALPVVVVLAAGLLQRNDWPTDLGWNILTLSPAAMLWVVETGYGETGYGSAKALPSFAPALLLVYVLILLWFRWRCLKYADHYLGRLPDGPAERRT